MAPCSGGAPFFSAKFFSWSLTWSILFRSSVATSYFSMNDVALLAFEAQRLDEVNGDVEQLSGRCHVMEQHVNSGRAILGSPMAAP